MEESGKPKWWKWTKTARHRGPISAMPPSARPRRSTPRRVAARLRALYGRVALTSRRGARARAPLHEGWDNCDAPGTSGRVGTSKERRHGPASPRDPRDRAPASDRVVRRPHGLHVAGRAGG